MVFSKYFYSVEKILLCKFIDFFKIFNLFFSNMAGLIGVVAKDQGQVGDVDFDSSAVPPFLIS